MKITLTPEDIVKRCLWDSYSYYVVGSEKQAREILEENKEIEMSERDALVIGLLKIIETDNLIHKFNTYIAELLTNKSMKKTGKPMIRKNVLDSAIDKFLNKFPDYWYPNNHWTNQINELKDYIENIKKSVDKLEVHTVDDKNFIIELYSSAAVKKLLKFNY